MTRRYFIAAEPVEWDYSPKPSVAGQASMPMKASQSGQRYPKYRYLQYTDDSFTERVKQPAWSGILGPVIRAETGDTLSVTFLNRSSSEDMVFSIHPHGLRYDKDNEGAYYPPNPGRGSWVTRGARYTYTWFVDQDAGPRPDEPSSKVWLYHSHVSADEDINRGLVGVIIITDPARARADATPIDVDREFVTLFMIFNENGPLQHIDAGLDDIPPEIRQKQEAFLKLTPLAQQEMLEAGLKYTLNGYMFGNLPGLEMEEGERVRWYVVALGSEQDVHSAHWHGETVLEDGHRRTDDIELLPGSMKIADMRADNPGTWMFHCHVSDHMMGGMFAFYTVKPRPPQAPPQGREAAR
jgi:FtsP/CotA-like multicopper oxidase with cupredoxin domain